VEKMAREHPRLNRKVLYQRRMKRAVHLLFYRRHRIPGVRGWELRKRLGSDYAKVLTLLDSYLEKFDFKIQTVFEEGKLDEKPTAEQLDRARYYVTLRSGLTPTEARLSGWRIDDIAGLAIAISFIISNKGKAQRNEVADLLRNKLPSWRVDLNLNRYIRAGYLGEDENKQIYLDWRMRAEVDEKTLVDLLLITKEEIGKPIDTEED
jgi:hypothetical protein